MSHAITVEVREMSGPKDNEAFMLSFLTGQWGTVPQFGQVYADWLRRHNMAVVPVVAPLEHHADALRPSNIMFRFACGFVLDNDDDAEWFRLTFVGAA